MKERDSWSSWSSYLSLSFRNTSVGNSLGNNLQMVKWSVDVSSGLLWITQQNKGDFWIKFDHLRKAAMIERHSPFPPPCSSVPVMPHGGPSWTGSRCLTWTDRIASAAFWTSRRMKAPAGSCADTSSWTRSRAACCGTWTTHRCVCVCVWDHIYHLRPQLFVEWGLCLQSWLQAGVQPEGPAVRAAFLHQQKWCGVW